MTDQPPISQADHVRAAEIMKQFIYLGTRMKGSEDYQLLLRELARHRLSAIAPGGVDRDWVLVPRDPTEAMIEAFLKPRRMEFDGARAFWTAMLAAAPKPVESTASDGVDRTPQPGFKIIDAKDGGRAVVRDDLSERMKSGKPYSGELHWPKTRTYTPKAAAPVATERLQDLLRQTADALHNAATELHHRHSEQADGYTAIAIEAWNALAEPAPVGDGRAEALEAAA